MFICNTVINDMPV